MNAYNYFVASKKNIQNQCLWIFINIYFAKPIKEYAEHKMQPGYFCFDSQQILHINLETVI